MKYNLNYKKSMIKNWIHKYKIRGKESKFLSWVLVKQIEITVLKIKSKKKIQHLHCQYPE
jgi:hypothetical protein